MVKMQIFKDRTAWLEARRSYIGGSDAAALVGENPYKSNVDLYREKIGQAVPKDISDEPHVQYGIKAEPHLRETVELDFPYYKVEYVDNNLWTNDRYPFAHASLDGWLTDLRDGRRGVLEIKTTQFLRSTDRLKWRGGIPDHYYCQVLWYLGVTEFDFAILKAQIKTIYGDASDESQTVLETRHYRIDRRDPGVEQGIQNLLSAGERFATNIRLRKEPNRIFSINVPVGIR